MARGCCEICSRWGELETHHIFGGALRPVSERYGVTIKLCRGCHQDSRNSAHKSRETREMLHKRGQIQAMREQGWNVEEFRLVFGKNYLDEDEMALVDEKPAAGIFREMECEVIFA